MSALCPICLTDNAKGRGMCASCGRSYDRWSGAGHGDIMQALVWAANRARKFPDRALVSRVEELDRALRCALQEATRFHVAACLCVYCAALSPKPERHSFVTIYGSNGRVCGRCSRSPLHDVHALSPKRAKLCPLSPDCVLAAGHARPCVVEVAAGSVVRAPKRAATKRGRKRPTRKTTTSGGA